MAHGLRGQWMRIAATGFGVLLCTGMIGCWNADKPKNSTGGTGRPTQGLPGTPRLDSNGNTIGRTGQQPGQFTGAGANLQQAGAGGYPAGAGMGMGSAPSQQRVGSNGINTNANSNLLPANYEYQNNPGNLGSGGMITPPARTGVQQPMSNIGSASQYPNNPNSGLVPSPPPPPLNNIPQIPPPSSSSLDMGGSGSFGNSLAAPLEPGPMSGASSKPRFNSSPDTFGGP